MHLHCVSLYLDIYGWQQSQLTAFELSYDCYVLLFPTSCLLKRAGILVGHVIGSTHGGGFLVVVVVVVTDFVTGAHHFVFVVRL